MASKTGFIRQTAPYLREPKANVKRMMYDVILALIPVVCFAFYKYRLNGLMIILTAVGSICLAEYLYYKFKKKPGTLKNGTALISGIIYALTLSDSIPLWAVFTGGVAGVYFSKLVFGGMGANIFNVAGFSRVFVMLSFGPLMQYKVDTVMSSTILGIANKTTAVTTLGNVSLFEMFLGINEPGSIGETSFLIILLAGIFLGIRKSLDWRVPVTIILTVFGLSFAVSLATGGPLLTYPMFTILSGGLIFGAVFMATDPITSPITATGRIYFGFGIGAITYLIRLYGALPEGVVYAILIMNMFTPALDYYKWSNPKFTKRSITIFSAVIIATVILVLVGV